MRGQEGCHWLGKVPLQGVVFQPTDSQIIMVEDDRKDQMKSSRYLGGDGPHKFRSQHGFLPGS